MKIKLFLKRLFVLLMLLTALFLISQILLVFETPFSNTVLSGTVSRMECFCEALFKYHSFYHFLPELTPNSKMIRVLGGENFKGLNREEKKFPFMAFPITTRYFHYWRKEYPVYDEKKNIIDGWGNPLIIKYLKPDAVIILRSVGKNGIHEQGKGDDITFECNTADGKVYLTSKETREYFTSY